MQKNRASKMEGDREQFQRNVAVFIYSWDASSRKLSFIFSYNFILVFEEKYEEICKIFLDIKLPFLWFGK